MYVLNVARGLVIKVSWIFIMTYTNVIFNNGTSRVDVCVFILRYVTYKTFFQSLLSLQNRRVYTWFLFATSATIFMLIPQSLPTFIFISEDLYTGNPCSDFHYQSPSILILLTLFVILIDIKYLVLPTLFSSEQ